MPRKPSTAYDFSNYPLGYIPPPDQEHIRKYPLRSLDVNPLQKAQRPKYVSWSVGVRYQQGPGQCVGYSIAGWCSGWDYTHLKTRSRYNAPWIYDQARKIDQFPGEDYEGTTVRAGLDVANTLGAPKLDSSGRLFVSEYRWATSAEDVLDHLAFVGPVVCGMTWYSNFDKPKRATLNSKAAYFIGRGVFGPVRGGHAILAMGYAREDDGTEYICFQNSWGFKYPLVWMQSSVLQILFDKGEIEAATITGIPREE